MKARTCTHKRKGTKLHPLDDFNVYTNLLCVHNKNVCTSMFDEQNRLMHIYSQSQNMLQATQEKKLSKIKMSFSQLIDNSP